jgi:hypothetical protein
LKKKKKKNSCCISFEPRNRIDTEKFLEYVRQPLELEIHGAFDTKLVVFPHQTLDYIAYSYLKNCRYLECDDERRRILERHLLSPTGDVGDLFYRMRSKKELFVEFRHSGYLIASNTSIVDILPMWRRIILHLRINVVHDEDSVTRYFTFEIISTISHNSGWSVDSSSIFPEYCIPIVQVVNSVEHFFEPCVVVKRRKVSTEMRLRLIHYEESLSTDSSSVELVHSHPSWFSLKIRKWAFKMRNLPFQLKLHRYLRDILRRDPLHYILMDTLALSV